MQWPPTGPDFNSLTIVACVCPRVTKAAEPCHSHLRPRRASRGRTLQESMYAQRVLPRRCPATPRPGLTTTFGGEVRTDTTDPVRAEGLSYNRFRTTPICSSLLTGRNHHHIGNGQSPNCPATGMDTPARFRERSSRCAFPPIPDSCPISGKAKRTYAATSLIWTNQRTDMMPSPRLDKCPASLR